MLIYTNTTEYKNDIYDLAHLFFPNSILGEDDGIVIYHEFISSENEQTVTYKLGEFTKTFSIQIQECKSELQRKKINKRFIKNCLYDFLSKITKQELPWGSLTGIRPTKLAYDLIDDGLDPLFIKETLMKDFKVSEKKAKLVSKILKNQHCIIKNDKLVDIYINIPICPSRCSYCSFISSEYDKVKNDIQDYVNNLVLELKSVKRMIYEKAYVVRAIYIGGGTPSILTDKQFKEIFDEINYPISEFTVECGRPETITKEKLEIFKEYGVTRLSINPQTFSQKTLKLIGRKHTVQDVLNAYKLVLPYNFIINMDIIAGLPGEKFPTFKKTLDTVIELSPDNVTVHTLSLKHGSLLFDNPPDNDKNVAKMVDYAYTKLSEDSYEPYYLYRQKNQAEGLENVGYTKKGKVCTFNIDSMEETLSIIACGAGAISKRIFNLENRIERLANPKFLKDYNERIEEIIQKKLNFF